MGMEDRAFFDTGSWTELKLTRYGLGGRGIDYIEQTTSNTQGGPTGGSTTTTVAFPVYDAHGNMVATLSRSANNTYTVGGQRSFDAWGNVRLGAGTGDPTGRYCANLGHKQDDESGLIYMRARYYEPTSGRFISEDAAMDGANWFTYCVDNPVDQADPAGEFTMADMNVSMAIGEGFSSMSIDVGLQLLMTGQVDWFEALFSFGTGLFMGGLAAVTNASHYLSKIALGNKLALKTWMKEVSSLEEFVRKARKLIGLGTSSSSHGGKRILWPIGRGLGAQLLNLRMYNYMVDMMIDSIDTVTDGQGF